MYSEYMKALHLKDHIKVELKLLFSYMQIYIVENKALQIIYKDKTTSSDEN